MLLSLVLTILPVTHARLLDSDGAAIALVDDPITTRKELELEEHDLLQLRPSYAAPIAKFAGGTALIAGAALVGYVEFEAAPFVLVFFAYLGGDIGFMFAAAIACIFGLAGLVALIAGVALIVNGARDVANIQQQRAENDRQLATVREELREVPQGVTLTRF